MTYYDYHVVEHENGTFALYKAIVNEDDSLAHCMLPAVTCECDDLEQLQLEIKDYYDRINDGDCPVHRALDVRFITDEWVERRNKEKALQIVNMLDDSIGRSLSSEQIDELGLQVAKMLGSENVR